MFVGAVPNRGRRGNTPSDRPSPISDLVDSSLRIGIVVALAYACARIVMPFAFILLWSSILTVMIYPAHRRLSTVIGPRSSALLIGLAGVTLMLGPMIVAITVIAKSIYSLAAITQSKNLTIPPPPMWLDGTPLVGKKLTEIWILVATNLPEAVSQYGHYLSDPVVWLGSAAGGLAVSELSLVISFVIAAVLLLYVQNFIQFSSKLVERITGSETRAGQIFDLTATTIRGVALGVIGVAVVQSLLIGAGFFVLGIRAAGPLTLAALLLGVAQVPLILLTIPVVIYVFMTEPTQIAIIFLCWNIVAGLSDNVLRPLMLSRGVEVPLPVILIGVVGGMIVDGLLGLFVGPVVLSVSYVLLLDWMGQSSVEHRDAIPQTPA
jgi:predicted PurR-regulated permease PerM